MSHPPDPSNPFAPPGPAPHPQEPQAWAPVQQPGYAATSPSQAPHQPFVAAPHQPFAPAPKGGNALAITAVVLSGLALLSVLAMAAFFFVGPMTGGGSYVLTGEVTVVDKGASYSDLEQALTDAIEDDGGSVDEVGCPERSQVGQGLVTVCHGSVDGFDWTGVVVFEDDGGSFIVTEY